MNRQDLKELLADVERELTMPGGCFDALYGHDEETLRQARFIATVALTAADRFYSRLTEQNFILRERDEHPAGGKIRGERNDGLRHGIPGEKYL